MEEELNQILSNENLDQAGRVEAIKAFVGKDFVPAKEHKRVKDELKNKYSTIETEFNKFKEEKMTDEEKQAEAIKLEKEKSVKQSKMLSQLLAENTFSKAGFNEIDYKDIIPNIIQENPETTKAIATAICNSMLNQKKTIEEQIKKQIIKGQGKPEGGDNPDDGVTEIDKYKKAYAEAEKSGDRIKMATYTRLIAQAQLKK